MEGPYIVFDVETPNAANDRISAIGVTVVSGGRITESFATLVDPEAPFDPFNIALTGITPAAVLGKPNFPALWARLAGLFSSGVLVAHNAPFDLGVLAKCLRDYGIAWKQEAAYLCTCQMGRTCLPDAPNHKLNTLCALLHIPLDHHDAGSDSRACAALLQHYLARGWDPARYLRRYDVTARRTLPQRPGKALAFPRLPARRCSGCGSGGTAPILSAGASGMRCGGRRLRTLTWRRLRRRRRSPRALTGSSPRGCSTGR